MLCVGVVPGVGTAPVVRCDVDVGEVDAGIEAGDEHTAAVDALRPEGRCVDLGDPGFRRRGRRSGGNDVDRIGRDALHVGTGGEFGDHVGRGRDDERVDPPQRGVRVDPALGPVPVEHAAHRCLRSSRGVAQFAHDGTLPLGPRAATGRCERCLIAQLHDDGDLVIARRGGESSGETTRHLGVDRRRRIGGGRRGDGRERRDRRHQRHCDPTGEDPPNERSIRHCFHCLPLAGHCWPVTAERSGAELARR